ncbi:TIGR00282 family metallophosphoesterase [Poriferisphaera sp. WC338]|uniref:TIGR00282 family metallophosphoesterase n=1 Tax=Poriferisphaera sp. WC338 TaxID=3425129 RepID=UPI003D818EA2
MRIIILGDIVGTPGRQAVTQAIPVLREQYTPDLIIANAENASNGTGLTPDHYKKLSNAGVDAFTLGDHVYKKNHIVGVLQNQPNIIRPANISDKAIGPRYMKLTHGPEDQKLSANIYVFTVLGRLFMGMPSSDPFVCCDELIQDIKRHDPGAIIITEVHAEATSEKVALGWYLNQRVACVFGTHTHIPTADARILPPTLSDGSIADQPSPRGTAYITDLGMCGPTGSVLGRRVDRVLSHMTTQMPAPFDVAAVSPVTAGIILDIDPSTQLATSIQRLDLPADTTKPPFTAS